MGKNIKKALIIFTLLTVTVCCVSVAASTRALHKNTPIYSNADLNSEVIFYMPQNAEVQIVGEVIYANSIRWQKVSYAGYSGYVDSANLYTYRGEIEYAVIPVKATSIKMGEKIALYKANSAESEIVYEIKDGQRLSLTDNGVDYGNFYRVDYNGEILFVQKDYVTTKLTYNQLTAIIVISSIAGLGLTAAISIILYRKKVGR